MKRKTVPVSEVELIDLHPDNRLSETVRRIPFLNYYGSSKTKIIAGTRQTLISRSLDYIDYILSNDDIVNSCDSIIGKNVY